MEPNVRDDSQTTPCGGPARGSLSRHVAAMITCCVPDGSEMHAFDAVLDCRLDMYLRERARGCLLGDPAVAMCCCFRPALASGQLGDGSTTLPILF